MANYQTGTATDVHNMLTILSTFVAANGWTVDQDAVQGAGRKLLIHNGESYFQFRSGTTETLSTLDVPIRSSNTVETGIWINGSSGFNSGQTWNRQPGRNGRYSDGQPIPGWLDTNGNVGSFTYYLFALTTTCPEVWMVVRYQTGPDRYQFIGFGELQQIGDWGFTRGIPFFTFSRNSVTNTVAPTDSTQGSTGPFGSYGDASAEYATTMVRYKSASIIGDTTLTGVPDDLSGQSYWASTTNHTLTNDFHSYTGRQVHGMATQHAEDLCRATPSTFNLADVLIPFYMSRIRVPVTLDGQTSVPQNWNYSYMGVPLHSRYCDMTNLLPADILTIGSDTWMVFPNHFIGQTMHHTWKTTDGQNANAGFAIRKV